MPTPTPNPDAPEGTTETAAATWDGSIGELFNTKCGTCHGAGALGGLNVTTYESAIAGGNSGAGVVAGEPANSLVFTRQESGDHPGQFSPEELEMIQEWIAAGAPEN